MYGAAYTAPYFMSFLTSGMPKPEYNVGMAYQSAEDRFLEQLAGGYLVSQDEFDQMVQDMPPELIAAALANRYRHSLDIENIVEAARLYFHAGYYYEALELCSRFPRVYRLQQIARKTIPIIRKDYPDIRRIGKLLEHAFLVIDLETGKITRFPPLMPATILESPLSSADGSG